MPSRARVLVLLVLLAGPSTACLDRSSPVITRPDLNAPAVRPPSLEFPALTRPGQEFRLLVTPTDSRQLITRYVLYDDGTFALQYLTAGEYRGRYREASTTVTLDFDSFSAAGATATLAGDILTVKYTILMSLSDFEDAIYVRESNRQR